MTLTREARYSVRRLTSQLFLLVLLAACQRREALTAAKAEEILRANMPGNEPVYAEVPQHVWWNEKAPNRYIQAVSWNRQAVAETEQPDIMKAAGDFMFSGLRLTDGISLDAFAARFGQNPVTFYPQMPDWISEGYMEKNDDRLRLTRRGLMVANSIFVHFV